MSVKIEPIKTGKTNRVGYVADRVDLLFECEVHRLSEAKVLKGTPGPVYLKRLHVIYGTGLFH